MKRTLVAAITLWMVASFSPAGVEAQTFVSGDLNVAQYLDEDRGHRYRFRGQLIGTA